MRKLRYWLSKSGGGFKNFHRNFSDLSYGIGSCHETSCLIESYGNVTCIEPCSYIGHCKSDYSSWPFDKQNCSMVFGPWMNNDNEIDYNSKNAVLSGVAQNTEWKLVSTGVTKKTISLASKDGKYSTKFPNLLYYFIVERHSSLVTKVVGGKLVKQIPFHHYC